MTIGVDTARDCYLVARAMREDEGRLPQDSGFSNTDLLNALYLGAAALQMDPFYDRMWAAMSAKISELEGNADVGNG